MNKIIVLISLSSLLLLVLGVYALIDPKPPYNKYEFSVDTAPDDTITIGEFQLFYDFDSQMGKIEFKVKETDNLEWIRVGIPTSLNITGYNVMKEERIVSDFNTDIEGHIVFDTFNSSMESATFVINIQKKDENIYPNAIFTVHTFGKMTYSKSEEGYGRTRIKFNLGKYSCDEPCFYDIADTEPPRFLNNSMLFSERKQKQESVRSTIFIISTLDKHKMILKEALFAISIGLLVGIVFLITELIGKRCRGN